LGTLKKEGILKGTKKENKKVKRSEWGKIILSEPPKELIDPGGDTGIRM